MICLCGYEQIIGFEEAEERRTLDPDFKNGDESFHRSQVERVFKIGNAPWVDNTEDKYLYACPKCGTVKIEL